MKITHASVFQEDGSFLVQDICFENGIFCQESAGPEVDASGLYAIPGLTDIHFHGCVGYDFCDGTEEAIRAMAAYEVKNGITTITPATMTFSEEILTGICRTAAAYKAAQDTSPEPLAILEGINMEGSLYLPCQKGSSEWSLHPQTGCAHVFKAPESRWRPF